MRLPPVGDARDASALRGRVLDDRWSKAWSFLSSRTTEPHMVTMARGKASDLGPLSAVWRDAYAAVSRAKRLEIVGYSMPDDDIEIRTLLRAGVRRGGKPLKSLLGTPRLTSTTAYGGSSRIGSRRTTRLSTRSSGFRRHIMPRAAVRTPGSGMFSRDTRGLRTPPTFARLEEAEQSARRTIACRAKHAPEPPALRGSGDDRR